MDNCGRKNQQPEFTNLFLFENGNPHDPEKLRVRRNEIEKFLKKSGKFFYFHSKVVHNVSGEAVSSFDKVGDNTPYVMVKPHETFICCNYTAAFKTLMRKRSEQDQKLKAAEERKRCKSASAIPSSCSVLKPIKKFCISADKYPCSFGDSDEQEDSIKAKPKVSILSEKCRPSGSRKSSAYKTTKKSSNKDCLSGDRCDDEDSDKDENDCKSKTKASKSKRSTSRCDQSRRSATQSRPKNGFWGTLCCKKPSSKPVCSDGSRPVSRACNGMNTKHTQTTKQDIKIAEKVLKLATKEEKRLLKLYGNDKKSSDRRRDCSAAQPDDSDGCDEREFLKARDKYRQKRKKMESQISKVLEKELRKAEVSKQMEQQLKKQINC